MEMTKRQAQVLEWLQRGLSNKHIASRLGIAEGTVKLHVSNLMRIYGVQNRSQLAITSSQGLNIDLSEVQNLEPDPVGWILKSGKFVHGFTSGKRPSEDWEPVYTKRATE